MEINLSKLSIKKLKEICKLKKIIGYSNKNKEDIIKLILSNNLDSLQTIKNDIEIKEENSDISLFSSKENSDISLFSSKENSDLSLFSSKENSDISLIRYIDLCSGIGGFRVAIEEFEKNNSKYKFECVLCADIKDDAIKTYNLNFNENNKKIDLFDINEITPFDMLCAGFPCFVKGTKVLTNNGYMNIENIKLNDKLLSHTGKYQNILNLQNKIYSGFMYELDIIYHAEKIRCTEEHPFYVRQRNNNMFGKPIWKKANELTMNDYIGMVINNNDTINLSIDKELNGVLTKENNDGFPMYEIALEMQKSYLKIGEIYSIIKINNKYFLKKCIYDESVIYIKDNYIWYSMLNISKYYTNNTSVYNFEVENDNSYIVENICVHNCQPFSSAGNKKGFNDNRGIIIFKIIELCKKYKPKYIILENVSNLISLENGKILQKICDEFINIDYNVSYKKLNSINFDVPQNRERIFILCTLDSSISINDIKENNNNNKTLHDIIDYNGKYTDIDITFSNKIIELHNNTPLYGYKIQDKRGGKNNIHSWDLELNGIISNNEKSLMNKIMTERRKKHWAEKKNIVWMDGMPLTYEEIKTFCDEPNLKNMLDNLVNKKYLKLEKPKNLVSGKRVYDDKGNIGYNICKGKLSFPITNILDPKSISPTLTATDSNKLALIIDNKYLRKLNVNELKLLCGFPLSYKIPDDVDIYDLFGNMVIPPVIYSILECIF